MAFRVQVRNNALGTSELLPGQEQSPEKAFNRALEEFVSWTQGGWNWNGQQPRDPDPLLLGDTSGPAPGGRYKIVIHTKDPANMFVDVRYDYWAGTDWDTNDITWRVIEV